MRTLKIKPCDLHVGILQSPTVSQITLSSVSLFLSLSEVDCFHDLWNDTPSITQCILCSQKVFLFDYNNFHAFWGYFIYYY